MAGLINTPGDVRAQGSETTKGATHSVTVYKRQNASCVFGPTNLVENSAEWYDGLFSVAGWVEDTTKKQTGVAGAANPNPTWSKTGVTKRDQQAVWDAAQNSTLTKKVTE